MAKVLEGVDQRTQLVGENRLELLLFRLRAKQLFGINVFKVREIFQCPPLTHIPESHSVVRGVANIRGQTITIIDLGMAIGLAPIPEEKLRESFCIVTEFNMQVQGFLVGSVDRIVNMNWKDILSPPKGSGNDSFLTGVTNVEEGLVSIIDVEKVLADYIQPNTNVSEKLQEKAVVVEHELDENIPNVSHTVLMVDDSSVARKQVERVINQLGLTAQPAKDGQEALHILKSVIDTGKSVLEEYLMVISDIEMPIMDGYTLTAEIRKDPSLKELHVLLHSSLSGVFNEALVEKVGANRFIAKYNADVLASGIIERMQEVGMKPPES